MTVLTSYSATSLISYMEGCLGETATILGFDTSLDYGEALTQTELDYGVSDCSLATDIKKLLALARYNVWKHVAMFAVGKYHFSADGGSYDPQQIFDHANEMLKLAWIDAAPYLDEYAVGVSPVEHLDDPYKYDPYRIGMRDEGGLSGTRPSEDDLEGIYLLLE